MDHTDHVVAGLAAGSHEQPGGPATGAGRHGAGRMKILVVDDSKVMRGLVLRYLRRAGYGDAEFREAANGADALAAIRRDPPDLVLCDWNMPEMTGIELLDALRAEGIGVKFGFVTAESGAQERERAQQAGATFLIAKPFSLQSFELAMGRAG